jgi:hypothetical protein
MKATPEDYKRWKFWERWGWFQLAIGVVLFVLPMLRDSDTYANHHSITHYVLSGSMALGILLAFSAMFIAMEFGGRVRRYEWRETYNPCPTCHQGWVRKEK